MCVYTWEHSVWEGKTLRNRKTWSNRNGQGLPPELVRKHLTEGTASKATWTQRDRHTHTDTNRNILRNTHSDIDGTRETFFYKKQTLYISRHSFIRRF